LARRRSAAPRPGARRGRGSRRVALWACLTVIAAAVLVAGFAWLQLRPANPAGRARSVRLKVGAPAEVAARLRNAGIIRSAMVFRGYAFWRRLNAVRPGLYRLSPAMSAGQIVATLRAGPLDDDTGRVVVPEGWTVRQIAEALVTRKVVRTAAPFAELCRKPAGRVEASFGLPTHGLEGYLFPDTYEFAPGSSPERIAQRMVNTFSERFAAPHSAELSRSRHTLHEIVTIASLVEREAEVDIDRAKIAGVIENRLRKGMRLQIDATVLYALGRHKERVLYRDLRVSSPYNTYRHRGLPPGPIANPGLPSLLAALRPERHDYLFYVATPDGSHEFTRTEAEHGRAVARWRAHQAGAH